MKKGRKKKKLRNAPGASLCNHKFTNHFGDLEKSFEFFSNYLSNINVDLFH